MKIVGANVPNSRIPHNAVVFFSRCVHQGFHEGSLRYLYVESESDIDNFTKTPLPSFGQALPSAFTSSTLPNRPLSSSVPIPSPHLGMLTINFLLALVGAAATMAQIMPVPSNVTLANNPIPGATTSTSNRTSSQKYVVSNKDGTSGRCGIHVVQGRCPDDYSGIFLRSVDWNGNVQYEGWCEGTVCAWPLLGMGDLLVSVQQVRTTTIAFYRQGTVSQDSWLNTDPEPRCNLGDWGSCLRQFDCGYACEAYHT